MRGLGSTLAALMTFLGMVSILPSTTFGAANLVANGGFENWPAKPSDNPAWGATDFTVGVTGAGRAYRTGEGELDTERHSGKYAQYISSITWGQGAISRGVPVEIDHSYEVSVWTKINSGNFQLGVCFSHKPWTYLGDWVIGRANGKWTKYTKTVVIPRECVGKTVSIVMFIQNGSGYLDDVSMVHRGKAKTELSPDQDKQPLLNGKIAAAITRKRIVIFDEPGFPTESPRPVEWYEQVLGEAGMMVTKLSFGQLTDSRVFGPDKFDTLILPTGGNFPNDAQMVVENFLSKGCTVVIDESMVMRTVPCPAEIDRQLNLRYQRYVNGEGGYAYFDYLSSNLWMPYANLFSRDRSVPCWRTTLNLVQNYESPHGADYPHGLLLTPWPNTVNSIYARPISDPLRRNPALKEILGAFPPVIEVDAKPDPSRGVYRLCRLGERRRDQVAMEVACDLLLPLYVFEKHHTSEYPGFPDANKQPRDLEGDFYILRYHNLRMEGGTLIHFGNAGAKLLRGEQGKATLLATLRLAESPLPGECPPEYVQTANRLRAVFSEWAGKSLHLRRRLAELARCAAAVGGDVANRSKAFDAEKRRFEDLSTRMAGVDRLLKKRDGGFAYGQRTRQALVRDVEKTCESLDRQLAAVDREFSATARPPKKVPVRRTFPFNYVFFGLDNIDGRGALGQADFRERIENLGLRYEGYNITSYRLYYSLNGHPFKREFPSGVLDPATGRITPTRFNWPETPRDMDRWQESFHWMLEHVQKDPRINLVYGLDECDLEWSLWDERTRLRFVKYLKDLHRTPEAMNAVWGTQYKTIDEVPLPLHQPQTQPEHAVWEDWTRFREVYRMQDEVFPCLQIVNRWAPRLRYITWSTYNQHNLHPANGVNFYEYGKAQPINGFEHANREDKEWMAFDIAGMFSPHITSEWGAFYFPPAEPQAKVDLLSESLWRGLTNGQVGWSLFQFSDAEGYAGDSNYFDLMNLPLPLGWQLVNLNEQFKAFSHIILDGKREEAPVRIVYSPTTHRHTSWPGVRGDISYQATSGLYSYFRASHLHARAIDEQAVWEGHLPNECKLLILSEVLFENQKLHAAVRRYLENGGSVLITPGSGRFNEYGRRNDSWLVAAGVRLGPMKDKVIPLANGLKYFSASHPDDIVGLVPVIEDEVKVLTRYADGSVALTQTSVGKGQLFVIGGNLGMDCQDQWKGSPAVVDALLEPVFTSSGIERDVLVSDTGIMVRPWRYKDQRYLLLTSGGREGIECHDVAVKGPWSIQDYTLGVTVKTSFDGQYTRGKIALASPGGVVLALTPAKGRTVDAATSTLSAVPSVNPPPSEAATTPSLDETHPFEGRLWAREKPVIMGDFAFDLVVETGGRWGGKTFLTVHHGKQQFRRLCTAGQMLVYPFTEVQVKVECREVTSVYPVNIKCRITVEKNKPAASACRLTRETFHGQESLVLTNGLVRARLVPRLGGRVVELMTLPDEVNHLACHPERIEKGVRGEGWIDFGGLEENAGAYPGPFWNAEFVPSVVEQTDDRVAIKLEMKVPIRWSYAYGNPSSGVNRLVKQFSLARDESCLRVRLESFNEAIGPALTGLRTHLLLNVGGDGDAGDRWIMFKNGSLATLRYPFTDTLPARQAWTAVVDEPKALALIQHFDPTAIESVYAVTVNSGAYDLELWARPRTIEVHKSLAVEFGLNLIRGITSMEAFREGLAGSIRLVDGPVVEALDFEVELGSIRPMQSQVRVTVVHDEKITETLASMPLSLEAGQAQLRKYRWSTVGRTDGDYEIRVVVYDAQNTECLSFSRNVTLARVRQTQDDRRFTQYEQQIEKLKSRYAGIGSTEAAAAQVLRSRLVRAAILLAELRKSSGAKAKEIEQAMQILLKD